MKVMDTPTLLRLAVAADKRDSNRRLNAAVLRANADPDGKHLIVTSMLAGNDDETVRCHVLIKYRDTDNPVDAWLDVALAAFNKLDDYVPVERVK